MRPSGEGAGGKRLDVTRRVVVCGVWLIAAVMLTPLTLAGTSTPAVAVTEPDHLALTPPMGWSNWDAFSPKTVTEEHIRAITDKMAALGMRDVGYNTSSSAPAGRPIPGHPTVRCKPTAPSSPVG